MNEISSFRNENAFLSNFYPAAVSYKGMEFPTVEHAFQAAKCEDAEVRARFMTVPSAAGAKKLGRRVKLREDWETVKIDIMEELLRQKFTHRELREQLLNTQDAMLIEGNNHGDTFWGVCRGKGKNNLGKLLMKIRQEIIEEQSGGAGLSE